MEGIFIQMMVREKVVKNLSIKNLKYGKKIEEIIRHGIMVKFIQAHYGLGIEMVAQ